MTTPSASSNDSSWGGTRQGSGRPRKRLRYSVSQKNSGRPPRLAESDEKNAERLVSTGESSDRSIRHAGPMLGSFASN